MADIKKKKLYEVHILLSAKDHVIKNVTRNSTCDDVIKSLHRHINIDKENGHMYALYESMYGVDRELPGKTKIYKLLRAWGSNKDKVQLALRRKSEIDTKLRLSTPERGHHKRHDKQGCNWQGQTPSANDNIMTKRLSRTGHIQKQRMKSVMESHSKKIQSQDSTVRHLRRLSPGPTMLSNDLTMQEINRHRRREQRHINKNMMSPKIPDPVHSTPVKHNFVKSYPKYTAVKFANSKRLKVKRTNETAMHVHNGIGTRPPCIGQVDPESFGHSNSRHMGDGDYSYYIEETYSKKKTEDKCLFFLDRSFRSKNDSEKTRESSQDCSALDIGFLEDTLHSYINRIDTENVIVGPDKDHLHHSKEIYKLFEKPLNTEIPSTDDARSNFANGKHGQQRLVKYSITHDQPCMVKTGNNLASHLPKRESLNGARSLVDYSFSDNESLLL
ncbi:hypothetical protein ACJMK2_020688 [Sinanodonta woodiana]|uniref:Ras-associating domain-containing protein n=1 Tax=Sinanodonta woodiana TaxID=1069815 RepID=A0ABD3U0Z2_SINWO